MNLLYRGRLDAAPAAQAEVLGEWDVLPADLLPRLASARTLVVLDPVSFPFESLRPADWDVPVLLSLLDLGPDDVTALGDDALRRLLPGDGVVAEAATWQLASSGRRWPDAMWLGSDRDAATERFLTSADRTTKAAMRARAAVLRQQLQQVHPWTAWDADDSVAGFRPALPSYIEWVESGPAAAVVASGAPDEATALRWWEAVAPGGVLVLLAEVVTLPGGPTRIAASEVLQRVLAAGPADAWLADVESVPERSDPHRSAAVFTFKRGDA
jgi:hypothetical protein